MTDHALAGIGKPTTVEREHATQDELLRKIDEQDLVPSAAFSAMVDTLATLRELPDDLAWFATRYLQACVVHGHKMFPAVQQQALGLPTSEVVTTLRCACGGEAPVDDRREWRAGRTTEVGRCSSCDRSVARFDGEPYPRPTLYAPGLG
jgi:hypothetical protein